MQSHMHQPSAIPANVLHFSNGAPLARQTTAYQMRTMKPTGCASLMLSHLHQVVLATDQTRQANAALERHMAQRGRSNSC